MLRSSKVKGVTLPGTCFLNVERCGFGVEESEVDGHQWRNMVFQYCHRLCLWWSLLTLLSWYFCHIVFLSTYHPLPHAHTIIFLFVIFFSTSFLLIHHHFVLFYLHITIQVTFLCKMTHLCLFYMVAHYNQCPSMSIPRWFLFYPPPQPVYLVSACCSCVLVLPFCVVLIIGPR